MFTLYYLNRNLQLGTLKVETLDAPVLIPEDLVFCNFRSGVRFIKEPHECIDFTDTERLIIASEFSDMGTLKDYDFRRANTYLSASCTIEQAEKDPRASCCGDGGGIVAHKFKTYVGNYVCNLGQQTVWQGDFYDLYSPTQDMVLGGSFYVDESMTELATSRAILDLGAQLIYIVDDNGVIIEIKVSGAPCEEEPEQPQGTVYSFRRDGSQEEGNSVFHVPTVNYTDVFGNPQVFQADMNSDACGSFTALSIDNVNYCTSCD